MHVILGLLGTIVTILWLLHRLAEMGVTLGGLNPWAWRRRRNWRLKHDANPIFSLQKPVEIAGLLATATAKLDGDMSSEEKEVLLQLFESEFRLSAREAADMLGSSTFLLGDGSALRDNLETVLTPSRDAFTDEQLRSMLELMTKVAVVGAGDGAAKRDFIDTVKRFYPSSAATPGTW